MATTIDIAREIASHLERDEDETLAAVRAKFPEVTTGELIHACDVGRDQVRMWHESTAEDFGEVFDMMVSSAPPQDVRAAFDRAKLRAETIFPTKPDKSRS
jgi:hypothetical protein